MKIGKILELLEKGNEVKIKKNDQMIAALHLQVQADYIKMDIKLDEEGNKYKLKRVGDFVKKNILKVVN